MQTKIEGIIIAKTLYRDRDCICKILMRTGKTVSILFFGGQGGGKSKKSSILELGFLIKVELSRSGKIKEHVYTAKEWSLEWGHDKIRNNYLAYYLLCFYLDCLKKVTLEEEIDWQTTDLEQQELFAVISNGLFYLNQTPAIDLKLAQGHGTVFLMKLIAALGIAPQLDDCQFCGVNLEEDKHHLLLVEKGGFSCQSCINSQNKFYIEGEITESFSLFRSMKKVLYNKYEVGVANISPDQIHFQQVLNYFCYQLNIELSQIPSYQFLK